MRIETGTVVHVLGPDRRPYLDRRYDPRLIAAVLDLLDRAGIDWRTTWAVDLRLDERHADHADAVVEHHVGDALTVTILVFDLAALRRRPGLGGVEDRRRSSSSTT